MDFNSKKIQNDFSRKENIIIFINPQQYIPEFQANLNKMFYHFQEFQLKNNKRGCKFYSLNFQNSTEKEIFEKQFNITIDNQTLFLLKNKYTQNFNQFQSKHFFLQKDYLFKYFSKIQTIKKANLEEFKNKITKLSSENQIIIFNGIKNQLKEQLNQLQLHEQFKGNQNISFYYIKDEKILKSLGINLKRNSVSLILKNSKNIFDKSNSQSNYNVIIKSINLNQDQNQLTEQLSEKFYQTNAFSQQSFDRFLQNKKYSFIVELDRTKLTKTEINEALRIIVDARRQLAQNFSTIDKQIEFIKINKSIKMKNRKMRIYIKDDESLGAQTMIDQLEDDDEVQQLQNQFPNSYICPKTSERVFNSFVYEFPYDNLFNQEALLKFINSVVVEKKASQSYISQKQIKYDKFSKKIVSDNFKTEIMDNNKDQALFFYSKHCLGCRKYGPFYEQLALKNLINPNYFNNLQFKRINDDYNTPSCAESYSYTPVFAIYKNQWKQYPIIYRTNVFTEENFYNFFDVMDKIQFVDGKEISNQVQNLIKVYKTKYLI